MANVWDRLRRRYSGSLAINFLAGTFFLAVEGKYLFAALSAFLALTMMLYAENLRGVSTSQFKNLTTPRFHDLLVITGAFILFGFGLFKLCDDEYLRWRIINLSQEIGEFEASHPAPPPRWHPGATNDQWAKDTQDMLADAQAYASRVGPEFDDKFRTRLYQINSQLRERNLISSATDPIGPFLYFGGSSGNPTEWTQISGALENYALELPHPRAWLNGPHWLFAAIVLLIINVLLWVFINAVVFQLRSWGGEPA